MIRKIIVSVLIILGLTAPAYPYSYYEVPELTASQSAQLTRGNTWTYNISSNILRYLPNIPDDPQLTITYGEPTKDGKIPAAEKYRSLEKKTISYYYMDKSGNLLMQRNDYPFEWAFSILEPDTNKKAKKTPPPSKPFTYAVLPPTITVGIEWKQNMQFVIPYGTFSGKTAHVSIRNKVREINKIFTSDAGLFPDTIVIDTIETMTIEGSDQQFEEQGTILYSPATGMPVKTTLNLSISGYEGSFTWVQELSEYSVR